MVRQRTVLMRQGDGTLTLDMPGRCCLCVRGVRQPQALAILDWEGPSWWAKLCVNFVQSCWKIWLAFAAEVAGDAAAVP